MKSLLLTLGCIALFHQARAEYIESNITIQLKVVEQKDPDVKLPVTTSAIQVSSFKTSDFIQLIAIDLGKTFSNKARLLFIEPVLAVNEPSSYVIRDPGKPDVKIPYFPMDIDTIDHIVNDTTTEAYQGKSNSETKITTIKAGGPVEIRFSLSLGSTKLHLVGPMAQSVRVIPSKQVKNKTLVLITLKINGIGSYDDSTALSPASNGYVQGTIKIGPPKIVPSL